MAFSSFSKLLDSQKERLNLQNPIKNEVLENKSFLRMLLALLMGIKIVNQNYKYKNISNQIGYINVSRYFSNHFYEFDSITSY